MNCAQCDDLIQVFEMRRAGYIKARAAPFYRVSTELAASKLVDMECSRNDLEEHFLICVHAAKVRPLEGLQVAQASLSYAARPSRASF